MSDLNKFQPFVSKIISGAQILQMATGRTKLYVKVSKGREILHYLPIEFTPESLIREYFTIDDVREFVDKEHNTWIYLYAKWMAR